MNANGQTTRSVLDSLGRVVQVFKPGQMAAYPNGTPSIAFEYTITMADNSEGVPDLVSTVPPMVTTRTLQSGSTVLTSYSYSDGLGRTRETQTKAPGDTGRTVTSTRYDTSGNITGTSSAFYNTGVAGTGMVLPAVSSLPSYTDLVIDHAGRTTESRIMVNGEPQVQGQTRTAYHGDYTTTMPPTGERTNTYTDVFGQVVKVVEFGPSTYSTTYEYTRSGKLSKITDAKGNVTTYTYNWLGERTGGIDPDSDPKGIGKVTYDLDGNVQSVTSGNGVTLSYTYDDIGRPLTVQNGSTVLTRTTYDTAPNGKGQPASTTAYVGGKAYTTRIDGYDVDGRITGSTVTVPADGSGLEGTYPVTMEYDAAGHQTALDYAATAGLPAEKVTTTYDAYGLPDRLSSPLATYVDATDHDTLGRLTGRTYGTAATTGTTARRTYGYDDATGTGWLKNITTTTSTKGTVQNDAYERDAGGRITGLADALTGRRQCYDYDELSRLSRAWTTQSADGCTGPFAPDLATGTDPYQLDYTYDGIGNLQKVTSTTAAGARVDDYVYPGYSADQSTYTPGAPRPHAVSSVKTPTGTDSYTYDDAGRLQSRTVGGQTTGFTWDELGHMVATTGSNTTGYVYDAAGTLLIRKGKNENVLYLGGQEIRKATGGTPKATRYYGNVAMRVATGGNGTLTWLMADQQASTQLAVDTATGNPTRRTYLPFGAQRGSTGLPAGTDHGFLGKTEDSDTGLSVLGARMYDARLGRFLSTDPLATPYAPQNLNSYSYAANDPVDFSDPSGLIRMNSDGTQCSDGWDECGPGDPAPNTDSGKNWKSKDNSGQDASDIAANTDAERAAELRAKRLEQILSGKFWWGKYMDDINDIDKRSCRALPGGERSGCQWNRVLTQENLEDAVKEALERIDETWLSKDSAFGFGEDHEFDMALRLAMDGHTVVARGSKTGKYTDPGEKNERSFDAWVDGVRSEFKQVTSERNLKKKITYADSQGADAVYVEITPGMTKRQAEYAVGVVLRKPTSLSTIYVFSEDYSFTRHVRE